MSRKFIVAAMAATTMSIALGVGAAFAGAAKTPVFATAKATPGTTIPGTARCVQTVPSTPDPVIHVFCGIGTVAGYGSGVWTLNLISTTLLTQRPQCTAYTAVTTFQMSGGTLVLDEKGTVCSTGSSGTAPRLGNPFGAPWPDITSSWTVDPANTGPFASTGAFAGVTGAGTGAGHFDGPELKVAYTETS